MHGHHVQIGFDHDSGTNSLTRTVALLFPELNCLFWLFGSVNISFSRNRLIRSFSASNKLRSGWIFQQLDFPATEASSQKRCVCYIPISFQASLNTGLWNKIPSALMQGLKNKFCSDEQIWPSHSIVSKGRDKTSGLFQRHPWKCQSPGPLPSSHYTDAYR